MRMTQSQRKAAKAVRAVEAQQPAATSSQSSSQWPLPIRPDVATDGERLGVLVYDRQSAAESGCGLWVYPACYDEPEDCERRAESLTAAFGVRFHAVPLAAHTTDSDEPGAAGLIAETGWYAVTGPSNIAALRARVGRGYAVARALTPRPSGSDGAESEAQP